MHHENELNSTFVSHEAHDIRRKDQKQDSEMSPRFLVAHKQSMAGLFKS